MKKKIGRPEKTQRNRELMKRRKMGWSYRKLAAFYGISAPTVVEIVQRKTEQERVLDRKSVV